MTCTGSLRPGASCCIITDLYKPTNCRFYVNCESKININCGNIFVGFQRSDPMTKKGRKYLNMEFCQRCHENQLTSDRLKKVFKDYWLWTTESSKELDAQSRLNDGALAFDKDRMLACLFGSLSNICKNKSPHNRTRLQFKTTCFCNIVEMYRRIFHLL